MGFFDFIYMKNKCNKCGKNRETLFQTKFFTQKFNTNWETYTLDDLPQDEVAELVGNCPICNTQWRVDVCKNKNNKIQIIDKYRWSKVIGK